MDATDEALIDSVRILLRIMRHLQKVCDQNGISISQYTTLDWIANHEVTRPYTIAELNSVSRPAVAALIAGLEKKGLLTRKTVEKDGRGIHLVCTKKSLRLLQGLEQDLTKRLVEIFGESADVIAQLAKVDALVEALDAEVELDIKRSSQK